MNIFVSSKGANYRRWVNIIPSAIVPGASQYFSGRRRAGLLWLACYVAYTGAKFVVTFSPIVKNPAFETIIPISDSLFLVLVCLDACRHSIPLFSFKRWVVLLALPVVIILLPILCLRQFFLHPFYIPTRGMQPTLMGAQDAHEKRGDSILVDKLTYRFREPQRGDIVAFKIVTPNERLVGPPDYQNQLFIKRIVGLPGERVSIRAPFLYVNGNKVVAPEIFKTIAAGLDGFSGYVGAGRLGSDRNEILLGQDEYLVLGDNSQNSLDGRHFGPISRKSIIGKVAWIYAPPERKRLVQ